MNGIPYPAAWPYNYEVLNSEQSASYSPVISSNGQSLPKEGSNGALRRTFRNPYEACNFIVTWNGEDVQDLFQAIRCARESQDRFIQDKLIEYILNIPFRNPRPADIPAFVGKPVWAVDKHGLVLVGMPGSESIVTIESLRAQLHSAH